MGGKPEAAKWVGGLKCTAYASLDVQRSVLGSRKSGGVKTREHGARCKKPP